MLCGESGSIDISEFLTEEIKGPGKMTCKTDGDGVRKCRFEEPGMNGLISDVFGDEAIFMSCSSENASITVRYRLPDANCSSKANQVGRRQRCCSHLPRLPLVSLLYMLGRQLQG